MKSLASGEKMILIFEFGRKDWSRYNIQSFDTFLDAGQCNQLRLMTAKRYYYVGLPRLMTAKQ
jgi:hypothetical protein